MKIPSIFYGKAGSATSRIRKLAKTLLVTREFGRFDPGPLLDTRDVGGLVLVREEFEPSAEQHFHCYALSEEMAEASTQQTIHDNLHDWLMASLDEEWRFICTLGGASLLGLGKRDASFARRYVEAAIRYWPSMAAEIDRFGPVLEGNSILDHWNTLAGALERLGLSARERTAIRGRAPQVLLSLVDEHGVDS